MLGLIIYNLGFCVRFAIWHFRFFFFSADNGILYTRARIQYVAHDEDEFVGLF